MFGKIATAYAKIDDVAAAADAHTIEVAAVADAHTIEGAAAADAHTIEESTQLEARGATVATSIWSATRRTTKRRRPLFDAVLECAGCCLHLQCLYSNTNVHKARAVMHFQFQNRRSKIAKAYHFSKPICMGIFLHGSMSMGMGFSMHIMKRVPLKSTLHFTSNHFR